MKFYLILREFYDTCDKKFHIHFKKHKYETFRPNKIIIVNVTFDLTFHDHEKKNLLVNFIFTYQSCVMTQGFD